MIVHGTEGCGISKVDENGFLNPDGTLAERYVLMMGASHTQGKEVSPEQRYSTLVNGYFSGDSGLLAAYNIASDGHFLPSQIQHFKAAVAAFPNADSPSPPRMVQHQWASGADTASRIEPMALPGQLSHPNPPLCLCVWQMAL